ncbi:alpha/beta-hydrolase [Aspergillus sclerotioniger CBS 115572]|uniref:Alpha/beta-hydrolase n=1 Tax=Aspergillus sclerotioniger CBS 115572 TaxID=1450535 RepID=A0A317VG65_9EURO|nr:alpha/beta-hydrolase [Aspergillus sclerotioniger CBS 115572]PWY72151.1 alpha/beta-hydrolase [Aspergillus sclerotioniger CBS 115572]
MATLRPILVKSWYLATLPFRILGICLYYSIPFARPYPGWTYHQAIGLKLFDLWWRYSLATDFHAHKTLFPGDEKDRFIVMQPAPSTKTRNYYRGILLTNPAIRPLPIGAVWYSTAPTSPKGPFPDGIVLHFHGGAYVMGGARPPEGGWGPDQLSGILNKPVLQVQYRLAGPTPAASTHTCFPAALQDAITAYAYVLDVLRVSPQKLIISGDSAGASLALTVLRYLATESKTDGNHHLPLPLPRAAFLWSPWLDLSPTTAAKINHHRNARSDYLTGSLAEWGASCYAPIEENAREQAWLSPLGREFPTISTGIFVQTGTAEVMVDENLQIVEEMKSIGNTAKAWVVEGATHNIFAAGQILGMMDEARGAMRMAGGVC